MYAVGSAVSLFCPVGLGGLFRRPDFFFSLPCMPSGPKPANLPADLPQGSGGELAARFNRYSWATSRNSDFCNL